MTLRRVRSRVWNPSLFHSNLSNDDDIMREIIIRLAWDDYDQEGDLTPRKPRDLVEIEEFNKHPKSKPQDMHVLAGAEGSGYKEGWVLRSHIEGNEGDNQSPYKHPKSRYSKYLPAAKKRKSRTETEYLLSSARLADRLIERSQLYIFQMRRSRKNPSEWNHSPRLYNPVVYRLKPLHELSNDQWMDLYLLLSYNRALDPRFLWSPYWQRYGDMALYTAIRNAEFLSDLVQNLMNSDLTMEDLHPHDPRNVDLTSAPSLYASIQETLKEFNENLSKTRIVQQIEQQNRTGKKDQEGKCLRRKSAEKALIPQISPLVRPLTGGVPIWS